MNISKYWGRPEALLTYISVLVTITAVIPSFMIYPLNYGWWQVWADMEAKGYTLYEETYVVFPPLFIKWTGLVEFINPSRHFSLVVGTFLLITFQATFTVLLRQFFSLIASLFGAAVIILMQIKLTTFIPDDYHIFERLFFSLSLLFFVLSLKALNKSQQKQGFLFVALAAASSMATLFTKQNIGLLLVVSIPFAYLVYAARCEQAVKVSIAVIFLFVAMFAIFQQMLGLTLGHWNSLLFGNDAKGSLLVVATNFFTVDANRTRIFEAMLLLPIILLVGNRVFTKILTDFLSFTDSLFSNPISKQLSLLQSQILLPAIHSLSVLAVGYLTFFKPHFIITVALSVIGFMFVKQFTKHPAIIHYLCFPLGGMMFASTMTSAFVPDSAVMVAMFGFAYIIDLFRNRELKEDIKKSANLTTIPKYFMIIVVTIIGLDVAGRKFETPYLWWGYSLPNVTSDRVTNPVEGMEPQQLDVVTADILARIKEAVTKFSDSDNDVLFYPHIPMQYKIHGKTPPTKSIGHWFDLVPSDIMIEELSEWRRNPPKLIVLFDPPFQTYLGHQDFKQSDLAQLNFLYWLEDLQSAGSYKLVDYSYHDDKDIRKDQYLTVTNYDFAQLSAEEQYYQLEGICSGYISEMIIENAKFDMGVAVSSGTQNKLNESFWKSSVDRVWPKLGINSKIKLNECTIAEFEELVAIIGSIDKELEDTYRLKIYVRTDIETQIRGS